MKLDDNIALIDEVSHSLHAADDLDDLYIFSIKESSYLPKLSLAPAEDLIDYKDDILPDLEQPLDVFDYLDIIFEGEYIFEVFFITPGPSLAFVIKGIADIVYVCIVLYRSNSVGDLPDSLDAAYQDIFAAG